jgi:hypothetical protein
MTSDKLNLPSLVVQFAVKLISLASGFSQESVGKTSLYGSLCNLCASVVECFS